MIWRALVVIASFGVIAAATHANVMHAGGYASIEVPLIVTLAILLSIGMGFVAFLWREGQRFGAVVLGLCILSGEAYWVLTNTEREIARREEQEAPTLHAREDRAKADVRLAKAEAALVVASAAVVSEAAKRDCLKNCAAMLTASETAAKAEVTAARAALANTPRLPSSSPLPERLGLAPWLWDLIMAGLRSLAVVGGSIAIGLATHPKRRADDRRPTTLDEVKPTQKRTAIAPPAKPLRPARQKAMRQSEIIQSDHSKKSLRNHAAEFGVKCMRADPEGETDVAQMHERYQTWCDENEYPRLRPPDLARELGALFTRAGLPIEDRGNGELVVRGVRLIQQ